MNKIFALASVLFWAASCQQTDKTAQRKLTANEDSTVTFKIQVLGNIDSLRSTLPPGGATETFVNFKVVEVINGVCNENEIRVRWMMAKDPPKRWMLQNYGTYSVRLRRSYYLNSDLKPVRTDYFEQCNPC